MAVQEKQKIAVSIYSDEQAVKVIKKLTTPEVFTLNHMKGIESRGGHSTVIELKKEFKSYGYNETVFKQVRDSFESKGLIETSPNHVDILLTKRGLDLAKKFSDLFGNKR
ncbi:MAG TPA: hypothetical protein VNF06_02410 [Candidatus Aquilonibacter sp.]|nr:hypothetical protein [Candidatus Aquilonibacter sp.]